MWRLWRRGDRNFRTLPPGARCPPVTLNNGHLHEVRKRSRHSSPSLSSPIRDQLVQTIRQNILPNQAFKFLAIHDG